MGRLFSFSIKFEVKICYERVISEKYNKYNN